MSDSERNKLRLQGHIHHFHGQDYVVRKKTARETANAQGYSDDFILDAYRSVVYKQVGNSVVPPVVSWILKAVGDQFLKGNKPPVLQVKDEVTGKLSKGRVRQEREIDEVVELVGKLKIK